jgi:hypothetical protein
MMVWFWGWLSDEKVRESIQMIEAELHRGLRVAFMDFRPCLVSSAALLFSGYFVDIEKILRHFDGIEFLGDGGIRFERQCQAAEFRFLFAEKCFAGSGDEAGNFKGIV